MSHTIRAYNVPGTDYFFHRWHQTSQNRFCGYQPAKRYASRKTRRSNKSMMYQDVLNMERSYVWFWEYIHLPHDFYHAYDCWVDDNIMPSIQYLQDGMRCCLDHKGCPAELCHVQNPKKIQIKTATIEDYLNKRG